MAKKIHHTRLAFMNCDVKWDWDHFLKVDTSNIKLRTLPAEPKLALREEHSKEIFDIQIGDDDKDVTQTYREGKGDVDFIRFAKKVIAMCYVVPGRPNEYKFVWEDVSELDDYEEGEIISMFLDALAKCVYKVKGIDEKKKSARKR